MFFGRDRSQTGAVAFQRIMPQQIPSQRLKAEDFAAGQPCEYQLPNRGQQVSSESQAYAVSAFSVSSESRGVGHSRSIGNRARSPVMRGTGPRARRSLGRWGRKRRNGCAHDSFRIERCGLWAGSHDVDDSAAREAQP